MNDLKFTTYADGAGPRRIDSFWSHRKSRALWQLKAMCRQTGNNARMNQELKANGY
ncbi:hypothetical protein SAMN05660691_04089 [Rheinheimera pacifica]|uniref:Uncharacterized protein n=1 Tax=Rheinheimera pacifica TaxID=173990 RepID=A0A1H6NR81_9GAMM|nr:hypothetical protein [Rheinheimera pacifica]SEI13422.1 hypothetical protein SAMN05660691_04089 [Rheinheimera pacifica]